jgi:hypothetical protein
MTRTLFVSAPALLFAGVLAVASAPALGQSGSTQSPPAPNSASSAPSAATSAPSGAMTTNPDTTQNPNPSGALGHNGVSAGTTGGASSAMSTTVPTPTSK